MTQAVSHSAFARALLDPDSAIPAGITGHSGTPDGKRFAIYRNNIMVSLIDALAARFPVTQELVGEVFFRAMARCYVPDHPPRSRIMSEYGHDFSDFIAGFEPAASVPYLPDMARLEALCTQAYHAADALALSHEDFAALAGEDLPGLHFILHPGFRLLQSRFAVASLWAAHQGVLNIANVDPSLPEDVLIIRPQLTVEVMRAPPGAAVFFLNLQEGKNLGAAAAEAAGARAEFNLAQAMHLMITSGMVVAAQRT
ncbi:MAG: DNA-binding domain-containing protein [Beijerinckiaceae bacterium]